MSKLYDNAMFFIDGVACPVGDVVIEKTKTVVSGVAYRKIHDQHRVELEMYVGASDFDPLLLDLKPKRNGASDATLAKRALYNNRKGRRARRRLVDNGFAAVMTIDRFAPFPMPPFQASIGGDDYHFHARPKRNRRR